MIDSHWKDEDFAVMKIDMKNAFNLVSRQVLLSECVSVFPELAPWAAWCYGTHPLLFHPLGQLTSKTGVQQGDPLGPLFFDLVLQKIVSAIDVDDECQDLLYQAWYHDDGILAGTKSALVQALTLIEELGPTLGIFINLSKCEIFCRTNTAMFPTSMKVSHAPHLDILVLPLGPGITCIVLTSFLQSATRR